MNKCVGAYPEIVAIEPLHVRVENSKSISREREWERERERELRTTFIHRENSININKLSATSGCKLMHGFIFHLHLQRNCQLRKCNNWIFTCNEGANVHFTAAVAIIITIKRWLQQRLDKNESALKRVFRIFGFKTVQSRLNGWAHSAHTTNTHNKFTDIKFCTIKWYEYV